VVFKNKIKASVTWLTDKSDCYLFWGFWNINGRGWSQLNI